MPEPSPAAPAVDAATSEKIRVVGLILTLFVVFHHGFNLQFATGPVAQPLRWAEDFVHFGLRGLSVPFFFVCSAYFLFRRPAFAQAWPGEVRKRVRSLLAPFLLWSAAWLVAMRGLEAIPALAPYFGREAIHLGDARQTARLLLVEIIPHPLWYMRDLFLLTLAAPLVLACVRTRVGAALYLGAAAAAWTAVPSIQVRESQDLFFFGVGALLAVRGPVDWRPSRALLVAGALACVACFVANILYVRAHAVEQPALFNLGIVAGLPTLWYAIDGLRGGAWWPRLARASRWALFVYLGHEPLQTLLRKPILHELGGGTAALAAVWLGVGAAVVVGLAATSEALARLAPRAYGLLTGGRMLPVSRSASVPVAPRTTLPAPAT